MKKVKIDKLSLGKLQISRLNDMSQVKGGSEFTRSTRPGCPRGNISFVIGCEDSGDPDEHKLTLIG